MCGCSRGPGLESRVLFMVCQQLGDFDEQRPVAATRLTQVRVALSGSELQCFVEDRLNLLPSFHGRMPRCRAVPITGRGCGALYRRAPAYSASILAKNATRRGVPNRATSLLRDEELGGPDVMRIILKREVLLLATLSMILCEMSIAPAAQWPSHATPGLPRTPGGNPDLSALAPRTADGRPDLSGVWQVKQGSYLIYVTSDLKPEEIQPWAAALYKQRAESFRRDTDGIACLPPGPKAGISGLSFPMKIVQTPNLVVVLYEYQTIYRQIFTDGRGLPTDPNPTWMGYSVGQWDGDTLVVTTTGFNDRTTLDLGGHPHTEALRVTERFRRRDVGHIDLQVTLDDPLAYTRPWTLPIELDLMPDEELIEYVCENERDAPHLIGRRGEEFRVPSGTLTQYVGTYDSPRFPEGVVVSLEGDRLMLNPGGAGKIPLFAQSESSFSLEGTIIEFIRDANGVVTGYVQHWTEGDRYATRRK